MTTRILDLPLIHWDMETATNEDWLDAIQFTDPLSPPLTAMAGAISLDSPFINGLTSTVNLLPGMTVAAPGVQDGSRIIAVPSSSSVQLDLPATHTDSSQTITFLPIPIDLTGIEFKSQMRLDPEDAMAVLDLSTANGRLISGLTGGQLSLNVPVSVMALIDPATYVQDLIAIADGRQRRVAVMSVAVDRGITR